MTPQEDRPRSQAEVSIPADGVLLDGEMHIPSGATGTVTFAHGSGSSRYSLSVRGNAGEPRSAQLAARVHVVPIAPLIAQTLARLAGRPALRSEAAYVQES